MNELELKDILEIIKKRKAFLIVFVLVVTLGTAFYSFTANPIYKAKARVLVNLEKPDPVHLTNNLPDDFKGKEFFETQLALIKSRSLIRNVIKKLNLTESSEFQSEEPAFLTDLRAWFKSLAIKLKLKDVSSKSYKPDPNSLLIDQIMERLQVEQVRTSRVLEISFQGKSPPLVAEITNALTNQYIYKTLNLYNKSDGNIAGWLDKKLRDLNVKLKDSENALQQFKQKTNFIEAKGGRDLVSTKWSEISQELTKASSERLHLETRIQELKALKDEPLKLLLSQSFLSNANLAGLQKDYIALNSELNSLLRSKTSQHPDVVLLNKKLSLLNQKIPNEVDNFISSLTIKLNTAFNKEKSLERVLENQKKEIMKTDNDFLQFRFLKQEVELNEKLYSEISNRKKALEVTSNFNSSNIRIVDSAEVPYSPIKPNKGLNIILAILSSIFVGLFLVFLKESQDKTLKMDTDVDDHLPYYLCGSIATIPKKSLSSSFSDPDEFRSLKAQFLLKTKDSPNKIFLFTSPKPGEGKTFITSNLAISLGNSGKKVLVVDGDFYNSKISSLFNCTMKVGYLDNLNDCNKIFHETSFKNVWVAPSGGQTLETKKSSDVFFSESFRFFLKEAEARWDYILIKAPPVLATPDARVLEKFCHGVFLVLPSGVYDPASVQKIFNQFDSGKPKPKAEDNGKQHMHGPTKLMSVVINNVDRKYKKIEYSYYQNMG
jgi:polysaccharide biosynthesis transport protein